MSSFVNPFFFRDPFKDSAKYDDKARNHGQFWVISADKIFSSDIDGLKEFAMFWDIDFAVTRFSLFDGAKSSDSAVCAKDVRIYMPPGRSCAMLQGYLANGKEISKIKIKKVAPISGKLEALEEKEFSKCIVQSFERRGDMAAFGFRYSSYSDSYTDFKDDNTKLGTSATKVDLATWEIESS
ncbi:hypothetical protein FACS1894122_04710 [Alphaproteobacteria bacterium]|nr:hypothetical protein FACS1894122_04710 [Alphaproteobacteria bacterium]